jgi:hypothetical protein
MLEARRRRGLLLSRTHAIAPIWNPPWGSWTPFWRRVVRHCGFFPLNPFGPVSCLCSTPGRPRAGVEDIVLGAEELRYAAQAVGKISGLVDVEDVLDVIFRQFCIGK